MPDIGARISSAQAYSGSQSLEFPFHTPSGGSHDWSEQRFSHAPSQEMWYEWMWYVPSNYYHNRPSASSNDKFMAWWGPNGYSSPGMGMYQFWATNPETGGSTINMCRYAAGTGYAYCDYTGSSAPFISVSSPDMRGQWHRIRVNIRLSDFGASNGRTRLWLNESLIHSVENDANASDSPATNVLTNGYLMGSDNSRYSVPTSFFVDDFKIYNSDPGWS